MPPNASKPTAEPTKGKRTFTPRPQRSVEERLPKLYLGLTDQVEGGHFANAIKTCRKILSLDATSLSAYQTLLFLHLQIDDYAAALDLVSSPPSGSGDLQFERAYCLYRLHREKEALEGLSKIEKRGRKEEHLDAQIRYRLGQYDQAQQTYDDLLSSCDPSSSEHPDIVQNIAATSAHVDFLSRGYHSQLGSSQYASSSTYATDADLESNVPTLPTGWATGASSSTKKAPVAKSAPVPTTIESKRKRKHRLPKGVEGKPKNEDPDRWLPLRQRATFIAAQSKKKGANQSMGVGMTQGSTSHGAAGGGGGGGSGGGGGNKKKKGKK